MRYRDRPTIQDNKLFVEVDIDVKIINFMLPFFVHFVLEGKLNVVTVDFHTVDEKQRYFIRAENFCSHHIVNYRLGLVCWDSFELNFHIIYHL